MTDERAWFLREACARARAALRDGDLDAAEALYRRAAAAEPALAEPQRGLGAILLRRGDAAAALPPLEAAARREPAHAAGQLELGNALQALGRMDEACRHFEAAAALRPGFAAALYNHGNALLALGRPGAAAARYEEAVAAAPGMAEAWLNWGSALLALGRADEAIERFTRAAELAPALATAHNNLGVACQAKGRHRAALAHYARAAALDPEDADTRFNLAACHLTLGELAEGWPLLEARWRTRGSPGPRPFAQPQWAGEPIAGRTILLHAEQGFGDAIQFCRYAPLVKALGAEVVLEAPATLHPLFRSLAGVDRLVAAPEPPFDLHCPLMSLPLAFGTTLATIPADVPYLAPPAPSVARWRARLGERRGLRVGLAWSGRASHPHDRERSLAAADLAAAFGGEVELFSLQTELRAGDREFVEEAGRIRHFAEALGDFGETAALASLMDLVVSVDTSVAHLAGAIGRPVWVLVPWLADWRWLDGRTDSPWYPTMRLVRQGEAGGWAPVLRAVAEGAALFRRQRRTEFSRTRR